MFFRGKVRIAADQGREHPYECTESAPAHGGGDKGGALEIGNLRYPDDERQIWLQALPAPAG